MDECMLNDLLECSVCLERLDTSSKVLPCQHTFCKRCLEEIVTTHKELRCPECRVLVDIKISDLPPNVLLMRILEGMRNAAPKKVQEQLQPQRTNIVSSISSIVRNTTNIQPTQHQSSQSSPQSGDNRNFVQNKGTIVPQVLPHQPYGRALYDYISTESDDLSFKKGDIILLRKRMDMHWYLGECNGKHGLFPSAFVQVIIPLPCHIPQCKALYDFRMSGEEEEGCLAFSKGVIINVIRRVDENWAEGRLNDRVGIFPLAFVELNGLARSLMKLSTNSQPGPSRVAPPTPTSEDSTTPLISTELNTQQSNNIQNNHHQQPPTPLRQGSESSSTISSTSPSTTPNTSSSNTSSSSSTAPSSPTSPPPPRSVTTTVQSPPPRPTALQQPQQTVNQREKRHSFSAINSGHQHHSSHRHSAEILSTDHQNDPESRSSHHRRSGSNDMSNPVVPAQNGSPNVTANLPSAYIALYSYTPQKSDELELRKGGIYMVTERCQDGWFKGTSNRTQKCGVFPGNYVAPARGIPRGTSTSLPQTSTRLVSSSGAAPPLEPRVAITYTRSGKPTTLSTSNSLTVAQQAIRTSSANNCSNSRQPPELPPRSVSPAAPTSTVSCSWHGQPDNSSTGGVVPLGRSQSAVMNSTITSTPNVSSPKSAEKIKDRKEKGTVSLMRRLTSMKRSKSPPPTTYSMDNPVFEDSQIIGGQSLVTHTVHSQIAGGQSPAAHPIHVRSGSCPSQLLQALPPPPSSAPTSSSTDINNSTVVSSTIAQNAHHRFLVTGGGTIHSGSQRIKHKDRGHIMQMTTSSGQQQSMSPSSSSSSRHGGESSLISNSSTTNHHRKSNSLDAGSRSTTGGGGGGSSSSSSKVLSTSNHSSSALQIRERFRCIVPYPPNSEYELELRLNDIIYVHKKRDDGWYKGTQQRTGRTGLFPASFVESF